MPHLCPRVVDGPLTQQATESALYEGRSARWVVALAVHPLPAVASPPLGGQDDHGPDADGSRHIRVVSDRSITPTRDRREGGGGPESDVGEHPRRAPTADQPREGHCPWRG